MMPMLWGTKEEGRWGRRNGSAEFDVRHALARDLPWMLAIVILLIEVFYIPQGTFGGDAHAYWLAARTPHPYTRPPNTLDAYLYSPAFLQALWPLTRLPWIPFITVWTAGLCAALWWLIRPLRVSLAIPMALLAASEVHSGNIFLLLACVAALAGSRFGSAAWAFPALTKVTLTVGPVWSVVRREWTSLWLMTAATGTIVVVSYAVSPQLWHEWVAFLAHQAPSTGGTVGARLSPPFWVRVPVGLALAAWGARTNRRWTVAVAMFLTTPNFAVNCATILLALPRIADNRKRESRNDPSPFESALSLADRESA